MAVDLYCSNCGENLGKDKENSQPAWCGTCGNYVYNSAEDRYPNEESEEEKEFLRKNKPKAGTSGRLITSYRR